MCYCFSGFACRNCGSNLSYGLRKRTLWRNDLWNEQLGDRLRFVRSPDVILCGWLGSKHQLTNYWELNENAIFPQGMNTKRRNVEDNLKLKSSTIFFLVLYYIPDICCNLSQHICILKGFWIYPCILLFQASTGDAASAGRPKVCSRTSHCLRQTSP